MFVERSFLEKKLTTLMYGLFNRLENNGNYDFAQNGEEKFIENLLLVFQKAKQKSNVIFDIGANVGDYSKMVIEKHKKNNLDLELHLFEPTKKCFGILSNEFNENSIILNNFGASDTNTIATIFLDMEKSVLASLYQRNLDTYGIELNKTEEVVLKRMDNYIEKNDITHINYIKIDVEGHELNVLEGLGDYLNPEFIDFIQLEYGGANLDSNTSLMQIYTTLSEKGFRIAKIKKNGLEIRKYRPYMDNFQYANYVAISEKFLTQC